MFLLIGLALLALLSAVLAFYQFPDYSQGRLLFSDRSQSSGTADLLYGRDADGNISPSSQIPIVELLAQILLDVRALNPNLSAAQKEVSLPTSTTSTTAQYVIIPNTDAPVFDSRTQAGPIPIIARFRAEILQDGTLPDMTFILNSENMTFTPTRGEIHVVDEAGERMPGLSRSTTPFSQGPNTFLLSFAPDETRPLHELVQGEFIEGVLLGTATYTARTTDQLLDPPFAEISVRNPLDGTSTSIRTIVSVL